MAVMIMGNFTWETQCSMLIPKSLLGLHEVHKLSASLVFLTFSSTPRMALPIRIACPMANILKAQASWSDKNQANYLKLSPVPKEKVKEDVTGLY